MSAMTAATSTTTHATTRTGIDLNNPQTFRGATLTPTQLKERFKILTELEESLDTQGKQLSPKSTKELKQVMELTGKAETQVLDGLPAFPICRLVAPHYYVQFGRTKVGFYKEIQTQILEVPRTAMQVLQAVQPMAQATWFQGAVIAQTQAVLSSDFITVLRTTLVGNMCLLRASVLLMRKPNLFREILSLYASSNDLYNTQISCNRKFELALIRSAEESYLALRTLHQKVFEICGPNLEENTELAGAVQAFEVEDANVSLKINSEITQYCDTFLKQIDRLKTSTEECIGRITQRSEKVAAAKAEMEAVVKQQNELRAQQQQIQTEYNQFQSQKRQEIDSRHTVTTSRSAYLFGFIPLFSSSHSEVVEADFGSKEGYQKYLRAVSAEKRLTSELDKAKIKLSKTMAGVMEDGQDPESLQQAVEALSTTVMCVEQLKIALQARRSHAQTQVDTCREILLKKSKLDPSLKVTYVLEFVEREMNSAVAKQAFWLASNRQTFTLQNFQQLEQGVRTEVVTMLADSKGNPSSIETLAHQLLDRFPTKGNAEQLNRAILAQLVEYPQMLRLTEGSSDRGEKKSS